MSILHFPFATITLSFCDTTGEGTVDYRHVKTREQLIAMLGCFMADLMDEEYLSKEEIQAALNTATNENLKEES